MKNRATLPYRVSKTVDVFRLYWVNHGLELLVIMSLFFLIGYFIMVNCQDSRWYRDGEGSFTKKPVVHSTVRNAVIPFHEKNGTESKGESICRNVMQKLFKVPFPKTRPSFLLNTVTGNPLELDCFNKEMKLAVEYHGRQHYEFIPFFHQYYHKFREQQYRDQLKYLLCNRYGITLIVVPYSVPLDKIHDHLVQECKTLGFFP